MAKFDKKVVLAKFFDDEDNYVSSGLRDFIWEFFKIFVKDNKDVPVFDSFRIVYDPSSKIWHQFGTSIKEVVCAEEKLFEYTEETGWQCLGNPEKALNDYIIELRKFKKDEVGG